MGAYCGLLVFQHSRFNQQYNPRLLFLFLNVIPKVAHTSGIPNEKLRRASPYLNRV